MVAAFKMSVTNTLGESEISGDEGEDDEPNKIEEGNHIDDDDDDDDDHDDG